MPLYGDVPDTARISIEQTLTTAVGGPVILSVEAQAPVESRRIEQNEAHGQVALARILLQLLS